MADNKVMKGFHSCGIHVTFAAVKKALVAILALIYITIASGVVVNVHYCMGKFSSVKYGVDDKDHCDKCGMKNKGGCCHTESKFVKLQDAHLSGKINWTLNQLPAIQIEQNTFSPVSHHNTDQLALRYHSPPDDGRSNPVYLLHCVFRI